MLKVHYSRLVRTRNCSQFYQTTADFLTVQVAVDALETFESMGCPENAQR